MPMDPTKLFAQSEVCLFGWLIDRFADTSPWGLLVMLFLGIVVAFRNIIRLTSTPRK